MTAERDKMGEQDILHEISFNKFGELITFLQNDIPASLNVINLLKSQYQRDMTNETELKVFCPEGETCSGVVIVTLNYLNKCGYKFIKLYSSEDQVSQLQQALVKTRKLKWTNILFEGIYCRLMPTLEQVFENKNVSYKDKEEYKYMFLPYGSSDWLETKVIVPEEFTIRSLTTEDAALIDKTWAYHSATTYDYVRHSIEFHGGLGLVNKHSGQLVSWAVGVWNTIGLVHTMPDYRHRGYAEVVIKALAKKLTMENVQPVCLISVKNAPSLKLFKKLGFYEAGASYCITI